MNPYQITDDIVYRGAKSRWNRVNERSSFRQWASQPQNLFTDAAECHSPPLSEEVARGAAREFEGASNKVAVTTIASGVLTGTAALATLGRGFKNRIAVSGEKASKKGIVKALGIGLGGLAAACVGLLGGNLLGEKRFTETAIERANKIFMDAAKHQP